MFDVNSRCKAHVTSFGHWNKNKDVKSHPFAQYNLKVDESYVVLNQNFFTYFDA